MGNMGQYGRLRMITRPIWKCPCINLYVLYNFWKCLFVKIAARVLGPDHIVTSLEHLGTVPVSDVTMWSGPNTRAAILTNKHSLEHLGTVPGV